MAEIEKKPIRVLLVEDDPDCAGMISLFLQGADQNRFSVTTAGNFRQARSLLIEARHDVVLLDLGLPDSLREETLSRLRKVNAKVPVVVLTGMEPEIAEEIAFRQGAQDFVPKGELNRHLLRRIIRYAIERKRSLDQLADRERHLRQLIERARDLIFRLDRSGVIVFANPAFSRITGLDLSDITGQKMIDFVAPAHRDTVGDFYHKQMAEGEPGTYLEFPLITREGGEAWIGQYTWIAEKDNQIVGLEAMGRDISRIRNAMAELEQSQNLLEKRVEERTRELETAKREWERTFDAVPDLISIMDKDHNILRVNRAFAEAHELSPQEIIGKKCYEITHRRSSPIDNCPHCKTIFCGKNSQQEIFEPLLNSNLMVSTSPLLDEQGSLLGSVHIARDISSLKEADQAVRDQLVFLQRVIDTIPLPVFFKDAYEVYTGCNAAFERMIGMTRSEIIGRTAFQITPGQDADRYHRRDIELLESRGVQIYETKVNYQNGKKHDVIFNKAALVDDKGEATGLVGVMQDITELRAAEKALKENEAKYRTTFEQSPISLWEEDFSLIKARLDRLSNQGITDFDLYFKDHPQELYDCGRLVRVSNVNHRSMEIYDADNKEVLFKGMHRVLNKDSLDLFKQELLALLKGEDSISVSGYARTLKGRTFYSVANVSLAPGSEKTWDRVLVSVLDITEKVEAVSALQTSEQRYRSLVEALQEGLIQVDVDLRIVFCNQRASDILRYSKEELVGSHITDFVDRKNRIILEQQYAKRKEGLKGAYELTFTTKSGDSVNTLVSPAPIFDKEGNFRGALSLVSDITERRRLEKQLRQSQKLEAIGQLAAGIAHEINTPVQFVNSNNSFLKEAFQDLQEFVSNCRALHETLGGRDEKNPQLESLHQLAEEVDLDFLMEEVPQALSANSEGLERISEIVRSMKEFAHPGKEEKQALDLNKIIETTVTVARNEWKYVADINLDLEADLPVLSGVVNEIKQVVLNLIVNAAHAIADVVKEGVDQKGVISISTKNKGDQVEIRISDTGNGVPPDLAERIFDPFFTTKPPGKGTGQGLAIAYRVIVETHGGTLRCCKQDGQGACFQILLPLGAAAAEGNAA